MGSYWRVKPQGAVFRWKRKGRLKPLWLVSIALRHRMKKKIGKNPVGVYPDQTLAEIIEQLKQRGVKLKDFDRVFFKACYQPCNCSDEYCFHDGSYSDLEFVFEPKS